MIAFGLFYSFALVILGLARDDRLRFGGPLLLALTATLIGYSAWLFTGFILVYVALTAGIQYLHRPETSSPVFLRWTSYSLWFLLSTALVIHQAPGYQGLVLSDAIVLKPGSLPTALYLNHDKVWVAWSLLIFLPLFRRSAPPSATRPPLWHAFWPILGFIATLALALAFGLIDWQPGIPALFLVFALSNLINTCVAEELLFRGVLQRQLMRYMPIAAALLIASALFGVAHLAGGWAYVTVATLAGVVYGLAYWLTGRLIWAVLTHWGLNMAHLLLFTYPMSQ